MADVDFADFEAALTEFPTRTNIAETMAGWVAEVLFAQQGNPKLQACLAGILDENGWTCTAPGDAAPVDVSAEPRRARAEAIIETLTGASQSGQFSCCDEEAAVIAERLGVPVALVLLGALQATAEQIDELTAWWPRKEA